MISAEYAIALQDDRTAAWHQRPPRMPEDASGLDLLLLAQHLANFELWHLEDAARAPQATDAEVARVKRAIDAANQRRNDVTEEIDRMLLEELGRNVSPRAGAELHSETPGMMLDRLSILALKLFHTREEIARPDAPLGHAKRNRERLAILLEQRQDLAACLDRLWRRARSGESRFRIYRQLKMYNDPTLNPAVYRTLAQDSNQAASAPSDPSVWLTAPRGVRIKRGNGEAS